MGATTGLAKKRITWLDMAKGIGMLCVIVGHVSPYTALWKWFYTFHLPLFFLLSGYVFKMGDNFSTFFKKKCKSLLLPYLGLGIPMLLFNWLYSSDRSVTVLRDLALQFLVQRRMWTLWFLACLFFVNLLFYLTVKVLKTNGKLAICSVVFVLLGLGYYAAVNAFLPGGIDALIPGIPPIQEAPNNALPWNLDTVLMTYPFFFVGYFYKQKQESIDKLLDSKKWSPLLFVGLLAVNVVCGYVNCKISGYGYGLEMWGSRYGCVPLTYLAAFAGVACVIMVSKWFTWEPIRFIGENSLVYFAWHQTIGKPLTADFLALFHLTEDMCTTWWELRCYRLTWALLILIFCTLCTLLVTRTPLRCLMGKPPFPPREKVTKEA